MAFSSWKISLLMAVPMALMAVLGAYGVGNPTIISVGFLFIVFLIPSFLLNYFVLEALVFKKLRGLFQRLSGKGMDMDSQAPLVLPEAFHTLEEKMEGVLKEKQLEEESFQKKETFRKEFIADVSHELKTPLFAAQGFVHTLLDGAINDKSVRDKFLKKAAKSLDGLGTLVHDLMMLSQMETGQIKMDFMEVELRGLAEEVFEQFENQSSQKQLRLKVESVEHEVYAWADRQRIAQVLTNLVSNAIHHSKEGGVVSVNFAYQGEFVQVSVLDQGEGISREHLGRIFERFYRADKSRSREKGGTGLGLAIVKHILEGHHSVVEVESEVGMGAVFRFKLRRTKPKQQ